MTGKEMTEQMLGSQYAEPHHRVSYRVGRGDRGTLGTLWVDPVLALTCRPVVPKSSSMDWGQESCIHIS